MGVQTLWTRDTSDARLFGTIETVILKNYRFFVPKTFRSQERKVSMENFRSSGTKVPGTFVPRTFRSRELSFQRLFVPGNFRSLGTKVPWNFRSRALSFSGTFVPGERKFLGTLGTFIPWTFRSEELSFPGLFVPRNFPSSDYFTRH